MPPIVFVNATKLFFITSANEMILSISLLADALVLPTFRHSDF